MATKLNQTTRPGQYLILQSGPLPAVLSLTGLTTATQGETASSYYELAFRLTGYGLAWPQTWQPVSAPALAAAAALFSGRMQHLQVRFTHRGQPATLQVDSFTATGTAVPPLAPTGLLASHYLAKDTYGTHPHEHLALALLAKLYRPGQLPTFLARGEGEDPAPELDDQDFLDLWLASCRFFALVILHARRLGSLPTDPELLTAYLQQRGIYLRPGGYRGADLGELRDLLLDQAGVGRARGTLGIFSDQGEFSRLAGRPARAPQPVQRPAQARADQTGWVLGHTSPSYAGTQHLPASWVRYQQTALVRVDLAELPVPQGYVLYDDGSQTNAGGGPYLPPLPALALHPDDGNVAQLGGQGQLPQLGPQGLARLASAIAIDPAVDYEVLWLVRQPDPAASTRLTLHLYNAYGHPVAGYDHATAGTPTRHVVEGPFPTRWTWVRTILWNHRQAPGTGPASTRTNLGRGHQLRQSVGAQLCQPGARAQVATYSPAPALLLADLLVRPLVLGSTLHPQAPRAGTPPSDRPLRFDAASGPRCPAYLGSGPHLYAWYRNLNPDLSEADIDAITRRELSPADTHLVLHPAP